MEPNISGIYEIVSPSGSRYVGSAKCLRKRWRVHRNDLKRDKHHCVALVRAVRKYGLDAFTFSVLERCDETRLIEREQFHIDSVPVHKRYNSAPIAGSNLGTKRSEESKARMRAAHIGREPRSGWKHSEATRRRISNAKKGFKMPEGAKRKIGDALRGRPMQESTKDKLQAAAEARSTRGLPRGVYLQKAQGKYMATHRSKYLGLYATPEAASEAYESYVLDPESYIRPLMATNTSGYKGVNYFKRDGTWQARGPGGKHLGYFETPELANEARTAYLASVTLPATAPEPAL